MNQYALEVFARDRLAELRARGELQGRIRAARPASRPLWVALGHALIRMGGPVAFVVTSTSDPAGRDGR
jgi:hypothetical protein